MSYTVFISHSSIDTWVARQVAQYVEALGASTFLDEADVEYGLTPNELVTQEGTPALFKRIDLVELNNIDSYFEQLKRRATSTGGSDV